MQIAIRKYLPFMEALAMSECHEREMHMSPCPRETKSHITVGLAQINLMIAPFKQINCMSTARKRITESGCSTAKSRHNRRWESRKLVGLRMSFYSSVEKNGEGRVVQCCRLRRQSGRTG